MELSALGWLAVIVPLASTTAFFVLGKDLAFAERIFASVHGIIAVAILPFTFFVAAAFPDISETGGTIVLLLAGGIACTSVFYSITAVNTRWFYHLLHVPTLAVIVGSFVFARFLFAGR